MCRTTRLVIGSLLFCVAAVAGAAEPAPTVVVRLYSDFAWEAVLAQPGRPGLAQQPVAVLRRYFTPQLASALAADAACASRHHEVCALDFLPLWASQDPSARNLSVTPAGPGVVQVRFSSVTGGEPTLLRVKVIATHAGWRVSDIVYPSGPSLAKLLSGNEK